MVEGVLARPLVSMPGTEYHYSYANYFLLAVMVASGKGLESYIEKTLFKPATMEDTAFYQSGGYQKKRLTIRVHDFDATLWKALVPPHRLELGSTRSRRRDHDARGPRAMARPAAGNEAPSSSLTLSE